MSDKILIVDHEPSNRNILSQELTHEGYSVVAASDGREALRKVESSRPDLIVLDYMMPDLSGLEVLKELHKRENDTPVVMITAYGTMERAVEAMREGAYDFITRPFEPDHIALVVRKALEQQRLRRGVEILSEEVEERYRLIVGDSAAMKEAVDLAKKSAASSATVLLLGESGTGKEIFARAIHNWSERKDRPFIAINSVGLSKELLESELFGHEQGAFTGAHRRKIGKIELAHGGTIFFDEIGDVSQELQARRVSGGRVVQRHVLYLGEIDDLQELAWRKSIEAIEERAPRSKDAVAVSGRSLRGAHRRWLDCSAEAQGDAAVPAADIRELLVGLDAVAEVAAGSLLERPLASQPRRHALGRSAVCSGGLSSSVAGQRMAAAPRMVRQERARRPLGFGCEPWRDQYALSLSRPSSGAQAGPVRASGRPLARSVQRQLRGAALRFDEHLFRGRSALSRGRHAPARLLPRPSGRLCAGDHRAGDHAGGPAAGLRGAAGQHLGQDDIARLSGPHRAAIWQGQAHLADGSRRADRRRLGRCAPQTRRCSIWSAPPRAG